MIGTLQLAREEVGGGVGISSNTHFDRNGIATSAIDHFMTNNVELYKQHGICPLYISDHYLIHCSRKKLKKKLKKLKSW